MAVPGVSDGVVRDVLLTSDELSERVAELGAQIAADYAGRDLRLVTILKGGLIFLADLARAIDEPLSIDFMAVSSYAEGAPGAVRITKDLDDSIEGAAVLVVEDIIDTGLTLNYVLSNLRSRGPASLDVCTLLNKDVRRIVDLPVAYTGFDIPDRFVVGYGLDLRGFYRNLPHVGTVREEALL